MDIDYIEYTTMQGDTYDMLALDAYNDEFLAHRIIEVNPQYASTLVFDAGIVLLIPILSQQPPETLPPWKR